MERPSRKLANSASDRPGLVGVLSTKNYQVIYEPFEVLEKTSVRVETWGGAGRARSLATTLSQKHSEKPDEQIYPT